MVSCPQCKTELVWRKVSWYVLSLAVGLLGPVNLIVISSSAWGWPLVDESARIAFLGLNLVLLIVTVGASLRLRLTEKLKKAQEA